MGLSNADVSRLVLALVLLLVSAHALGRLCTRLRQPKVAGEILGGLLLGPTLFGLLLPSWQHAVFQSGRVAPVALGVFYQLGLVLLMYCSGAEARSILARRERKATVGIALLANAVPFAAGPRHLSPCRLLAGSNAPPRPSPPHRDPPRGIESRLQVGRLAVLAERARVRASPFSWQTFGQGPDT